MKNILTVDLEDWYHICSLADAHNACGKDKLENRLIANTDRLLRLFREHNTKVTFFVLGVIAEKNVSLIKRIFDEGHEICSHGYSHKILMDLSPETFRCELRKTDRILKSITGYSPLGFRAPSFSVTAATEWALDILAEEEYVYDSSIFPVRRSEGGFPGMPSDPFTLRLKSGKSIKEFPITTARILGRNIPFSGGGYLRVYPYCIVSYFFKALNKENKQVISYIHPRDIDKEQPRLRMPFLNKLKTYSGLAKTETKLRRLLEEFKFYPIRDFL